MDAATLAHHTATHQVQTPLKKASSLDHSAHTNAQCVPHAHFIYCSPVLPVFRVHTQGGGDENPNTWVTFMHVHTNHWKYPSIEGSEVSALCMRHKPRTTFSCNKGQWLLSSFPTSLLLTSGSPNSPFRNHSLPLYSLSPPPYQFHHYPLQWTCRIPWCPCAFLCPWAGVCSLQMALHELAHSELDTAGMPELCRGDWENTYTLPL